MLRLLASLLLVSCASAQTKAPAPAPPASKPVAEEIASNSPRSTPGGATFTAPAGWSMLPGDSFVILQPPEKDTRIVLADVSAKDADAAVAAAWKAYKPGATRPLRVATDRPARNGWDQRRVYDYETSPNERATVYAIAYRAGAAWTVLIVDGTDMTMEKRAAPTSLLIQSLRPKGYQRESFAGREAHPLDEGRLAQLRALVEQGREQLGIPGVGYALIQGGRIVYEGGAGVRELGKPEPVDANTLFIAASNTKALTTLLLAKLVDEGKLSWDEPVTKAYPSFKLGDAETTRQVLIKHLICACTGLPRQDLEWIFEYRQSTPESAMRLLGTMQPTSRFGEVFQYSNLMAAAAGFVGASLFYPGRELGQAYDDAMRTQIFAPLGMSSTTFDFAQAIRGDHASPHGFDVDGKTALGKMDLNYAVVPVRPAGGVWTSPHDLSQYVLLELNAGKLPDGRQLVSAANLEARRKPQVLLGEDQSYGMGLMEDRTWGVTVVHHGGDLAGYHSDMMWLPDYGVGAVILTNQDFGWRLRRPFMRRLLEVLFDGRPEASEDLKSSAATVRAEFAKERQRLVVPADPQVVAKLAPRYHNDALGDVSVRGGSIDVGEWQSAIATRKNDDGTYSLVTIDPTLAGFEFVVGERGGKRALIVRDGQHEYFFEET